MTETVTVQLVEPTTLVVTPQEATIVTSSPGPQGATGATGATGAKGDTGNTGAAATIAAGSTTTLSAGSSATVSNSGTSSAAVFNFGIPQGIKGDTGATGATGATGSSGVVTVNAPITNAGTSTAANLSVSAGSTSAAGVLQLTDSVASTSTTTAATPNSVKTSYDLANAAVAKTAYKASWGSDSVQETFSRFFATNSLTIATGTMRYVQFVPVQDITVSSIAISSGSVASAAVTLARFGIYAINGSSLQLVSRTASDTTIFNTASTVYTRSLDTTGGYPATYTLTAGTRYYVGLIVVGTTAGSVVNTTLLPAQLAALSPALSYSLAAQSDLPTAPTIASLTVSTAPYYARLS